MSGILVIVGLVILLGIIAVVLYNRFVTLRNRSENAWAQVDVQLRRRYDLIPNLVETVKGYASHERQTLEAVIQARNTAVAAQTVQEQGQAENMLTGALRQLFALSESYPQLRANENFMQLQAQLEETENDIAVARQIYNDTVLRYSTAIQTFPGVLLAGPFGFGAKVYLEIDEASRAAPRVSFSDPPAQPPGAQPPSA